MSSFDTLIVPEDLSDEAVEKLALSMGVSSVCRGVPDRLAGVLSADDLPTVYTESAEESTTTEGVLVETREITLDDAVIAPALVAVVAELAVEVETEVETEREADTEPEGERVESPG